MAPRKTPRKRGFFILGVRTGSQNIFLEKKVRTAPRPFAGISFLGVRTGWTKRGVLFFWSPDGFCRCGSGKTWSPDGSASRFLESGRRYLSYLISDFHYVVCTTEWLHHPVTKSLSNIATYIVSIATMIYAHQVWMSGWVGGDASPKVSIDLWLMHIWW